MAQNEKYYIQIYNNIQTKQRTESAVHIADVLLQDAVIMLESVCLRSFDTNLTIRSGRDPSLP